jgi:hypothetical protein
MILSATAYMSAEQARVKESILSLQTAAVLFAAEKTSHRKQCEQLVPRFLRAV